MHSDLNLLYVFDLIWNIMIECCSFCINKHGYEQIMEDTLGTCQLVAILSSKGLGGKRVKFCILGLEFESFMNIL